MGYEFGQQQHLARRGPTLDVRATRWSGYWQLQGEISHSFRGLNIGLQLTSVGRYRELSLSAGRSF